MILLSPHSVGLAVIAMLTRITGSACELPFTGLVPRRHARMRGGIDVVVGWDQHQQRAASSTTTARIIYAYEGYM